jgi:hypothetical protein
MKIPSLLFTNVKLIVSRKLRRVVLVGSQNSIFPVIILKMTENNEYGLELLIN